MGVLEKATKHKAWVFRPTETAQERARREFAALGGWPGVIAKGILGGVCLLLASRLK